MKGNVIAGQRRPGGIDDKHVRRNQAFPTQTLPPNEGELTRALSNQKRFFYALVTAGIEGGLEAMPALTRARDAIEWLRSQAVTANLDSEYQWIIKQFTIAGFKADRATKGVTIAQRAIESCRLCQGQFAAYRKMEREKARRGEMV